MLASLGGRLNKLRLCLMLDWRLAEYTSQCVALAAKIERRAEARGLRSIKTRFTLHVMPQPAGGASLAQLVREVGEGQGRAPVPALMYLHQRDGGWTPTLLRALVESGAVPRAVGIEVAPGYADVSPRRTVTVRGIAGPVQVPERLDGIRGVVRLLKQLAGS